MSDHQPPPATPVTPVEPPAQDVDGSTPDEGLLETAITVFTNPVEVLRRVTSRPRVGWAVAISITLTLLSSVTGAAGFESAPPPPGMEIPLPPLPVLLVGAAIFGPIFGLIGLAIGTGILQVMSLMLGGKGAYKGLFVGLAFATVPSIVQIPVQVLALVAGPVGQVLAGIVNFGVTIWIIGLAVIAVRENNNFTTGRAVAAVLVPVGVLFVVVFVLALLVVALAVGTISG